MFLYLVRHGEAHREAEDPLRALSEKGIAEVARIASAVKNLNISVLRIFHSPKVRAKQTAHILFEYLNPAQGLSETDGLAPLDNPEIWAMRVGDMVDDVILVGHLPHLGRLASLLLCGRADKDVIAFRAGGIACLNRNDAGAWSLEWILTPDSVGSERGIGHSCDSL